VLASTSIVLAASMPTSTEVPTAVVGAGGGKASSSYFTATVTVGQAIAGRGETSAHQFLIGFRETVDPGPTTGVGDDLVQALPDQLLNCAPNPFNPATTIRFSLSEAATVRLDLYDLRGRRVARLLEEPRAPGSHTLDFRPTNLASGVYVLEMRAGTFRDTRRMVLLK